jgi:hypothetical protein
VPRTRRFGDSVDHKAERLAFTQALTARSGDHRGLTIRAGALNVAYEVLRDFINGLLHRTARGAARGGVGEAILLLDAEAVAGVHKRPLCNRDNRLMRPPGQEASGAIELWVWCSRPGSHLLVDAVLLDGLHQRQPSLEVLAPAFRIDDEGNDRFNLTDPNIEAHGLTANQQG